VHELVIIETDLHSVSYVTCIQNLCSFPSTSCEIAVYHSYFYDPPKCSLLFLQRPAKNCHLCNCFLLLCPTTHKRAQCYCYFCLTCTEFCYCSFCPHDRALSSMPCKRALCNLWSNTKISIHRLTKTIWREQEI